MIRGSLAGADPLLPSPAPGPGQAVLAYVELDVGVNRIDHLGISIDHIDFDEDPHRHDVAWLRGASPGHPGPGPRSEPGARGSLPSALGIASAGSHLQPSRFRTGGPVDDQPSIIPVFLGHPTS